MIIRALYGMACLLMSTLVSASDLHLDLSEDWPSLQSLYLDLHQHPELSFQEKESGAKLAQQLNELGFEVTTEVGGFGVVGLFFNGNGPTVMIRADTDALVVALQA